MIWIDLILYWYMYWFYIVVNCTNDHFYWMWWCHAATVAPIQVDNPCFMVPMRTQRRQWREKEIEREGGCWSVVCEWNQYSLSVYTIIILYVIISVYPIFMYVHICSWSLHGFNMHPVTAFIWPAIPAIPAMTGSTHKKQCRFPWISNQTGGPFSF